MRFSSLQRKLAPHHLYMKDGAIHIEGVCKDWDEYLRAGRLAVRAKSRGVVNDLKVPGLEETPMYVPSLHDDALCDSSPDVLVIGAGIIGCAIARELSKKRLDVLVCEKEDDVAMRASSRNDGMVHPGLDIRPGLKKASYNSRGNRMYDDLSKELGFDFVRNGSYIVLPKWWMPLLYPVFLYRARRNGVDGLSFVSRKRLMEEQPSVASWQHGAVFTPSSGIISPYKVTVALSENAARNGVRFSFRTVVLSMETVDGRIVSVTTNRGFVRPKVVINAAGVYCDRIAEMADDRFFSIHPRKGSEAILDKNAASLTASVIAKLPFGDVRNHTKGGGVVRTIDGNILVGPNAKETMEREDDSTDRGEMHAIFEKHKLVVPSLRENDVITYFSGTRAATWEEDFIVEKSRKVANLIHAAGIQSPGVTAAPAIAVDIARFACEMLSPVEDNGDFNPSNPVHPHLSSLSIRERDRLIGKRPSYGRIVCRCECVSEGEVEDALDSKVPFIPSIDAVKRRCRSGMGRCQGSFCSPRVSEIIQRKRGIDATQVYKGRGLFTPYGIKGVDDVE